MVQKPKAFGHQYWMKQGKRLRDRDDPWKALHAYEKATVKRPEDSRAYAGMGWCYLDLDKPVAAQHQFRKALLVNPTASYALVGMGFSYRATAKDSEALDAFRKYLEVAPAGRYAAEARSQIEQIEGQQ